MVRGSKKLQKANPQISKKWEKGHFIKKHPKKVHETKKTKSCLKQP